MVRHELVSVSKTIEHGSVTCNAFRRGLQEFENQMSDFNTTLCTESK